MRFQIPIRPGELFDRLSILKLKQRNLPQSDVQSKVSEDLLALENMASKLPRSEELSRLSQELFQINAALWDLENTVRRYLRDDDKGKAFASAAAEIFQRNEDRSAVKSAIDRLTTGETAELKSFDIGNAPENR